jgi:transcriptional regulator with XRE-family HTH domain
VSGQVTWLDNFRREVLWRLDATGITRRELAAHVSASETHIGEILSGKANGSHELLEKIAGAMGLQVTVTVVGAPAVRVHPAAQVRPATVPPAKRSAYSLPI